MKQFVAKYFARPGTWIALLLVLTACAVPAAAQKNKDKGKAQPVADSQPDLNLPESDSQLIDETVGQALGYWQIGDVDSLHKFYADDVVVVSGLWEPPLVGWTNYVKAYQDQRAHATGGRMERSNTLIKVTGNSAWATYQFVYVVMLDGKVAQFHGHTTLVLNKQGDRWLIVLNHSSIVDSSYSNQATPVGSSQPSQPGQP